jgi:hypothetical protein
LSVLALERLAERVWREVVGNRRCFDFEEQLERSTELELRFL